jgi:rSAM/selenodomain-associated transferase 2
MHGGGTVSVIVPTWNDAPALEVLLPALKRLRGISEIVIADASSDEACAKLASVHSARLVRCVAPNRGAQMNAGASVATGDLLLFHHADSVLAQAHVDSLLKALGQPEWIGGAFHRGFDRRHATLRWFVEPLVRFASRHGGNFYGDQSIFVRRDAFVAMNGFAEIPLMEDLEFSQRLRAARRPLLVLDPPILSSDRRHRARGTWRTTFQNAAFILLFRLGVSPHRLHAWYYDLRRNGKTVERASLVPQHSRP